MKLQPVNRAQGWRGTEAPGLPRRHLARIGDCSWQVIDHAHTIGPPGYPKVLADMVRRDLGIAMSFSNHFAGTAGDATADMLAKLVPPDSDAIVVHIGVQHGMRRVWFGPRAADPVMWAWQRTPRFGAIAHRAVSAPFLRWWGRSYWPATRAAVHDDDIRRLFDWLTTNRPGVPWAVLSPHPVIRSGWADPVAVDRAAARYLSIAAEYGGEPIDYRPAIMNRIGAEGASERDVFGATGYDLRAPGHEVIAEAVLEWLRPRWTAER